MNTLMAAVGGRTPSPEPRLDDSREAKSVPLQSEQIPLTLGVARQMAIVRTELGLTGSGLDDDLGTEAKSKITKNKIMAAMPLVIGGYVDKVIYLLVFVSAILIGLSSVASTGREMTQYHTESQVEIVQTEFEFPGAEFCVVLEDPQYAVTAVKMPTKFTFGPEGALKGHDWTTVDIDGEGSPGKVRSPGVTEIGTAEIIQYTGTMNIRKGADFVVIPSTITHEVTYCDWYAEWDCHGVEYDHPDAKPEWGHIEGEKVCVTLEPGLFKPASTKDYLNPFFDVLLTCDPYAARASDLESWDDDGGYYDDGGSTSTDTAADGRDHVCVKDLVIVDRIGECWNETHCGGRKVTAEIPNDHFIGGPFVLGTIDVNNQGAEYVDVQAPITTGRLTLSKLSHTDQDGKTTSTDTWTTTYSSLDPFGKGDKAATLRNTLSPTGYLVEYFTDGWDYKKHFHPGYEVGFWNPKNKSYVMDMPEGYTHGPAQTPWIKFDAFLNLQSTDVFSTESKDVPKKSTDDLFTAIGAASAIIGLLVGLFFKPVVGFMIKDTNTGNNKQPVKAVWTGAAAVRAFKLENIETQTALLTNQPGIQRAKSKLGGGDSFRLATGQDVV